MYCRHGSEIRLEEDMMIFAKSFCLSLEIRLGHEFPLLLIDANLYCHEIKTHRIGWEYCIQDFHLQDILHESIETLSSTAEGTRRLLCNASFRDYEHRHSNFVNHVGTFIDLGMKRRIPYDAVSSVIASAILLNAYMYPRGTH